MRKRTRTPKHGMTIHEKAQIKRIYGDQITDTGVFKKDVKH